MPSAERRHLLRSAREIVFRIPENAPARYHRYIIVSNRVFVFALVGHSLYVPIYGILGSPYSFIFNILSVPIDGLCLYLNYRHYFRISFGIWVSLVAIHSIQSALVYGWEAGFQYYILSLTVFVFIAPWKTSAKIILTGALFALFAWLSMTQSVPLIRLNSGALTAIELSNIAVNFTALGYIANYYTLAAHRTQTALEESERTLKTTLVASPVGIALVKHRKIFWANDTMAVMLGYDKDESIDTDITRFFPNIREIDRIESLVHGVGQPVIDLTEARLSRKDGSTFECYIKIRPISPRDESKGSIIVVMDITSQKAAEREKTMLQTKIQRAEKMEAVGTLAGGVAHDLNNILSGILSYPELLLMDMAVDHPLRKPLETIQRSGEKASAIVQDLLTLARRGVGIKQIVDLNGMVSDYLASPEHERLIAFHPQVQIETHLSKNPVYTSGSSIHLSKTLMNLASNACEAMPQGGRLQISTENRRLEAPFSAYEIIPPGDYAMVSVADSGSGISHESLERIFEPFYTKKVMGRSGTGLGLAVVWGTVKDCGGFVDVASRPEEGTRIDLYFPSATGAPDTATTQPLLADFLGAGEHVLVIDDVEEQRVIAAGMLEKLGYTVDAVAGGEEAVQWLQTRQSDVLLLDMIMTPGINGLETYRRVLDLHPGQKAIIASGYSETRQVTQALALGAARFLRKPYTMMELGKALKEAIAEPET